MFSKNKKPAEVATFFVCVILLLAAMAGISYAAGSWSQTGVGNANGEAYRISISPDFKNDKTAFWVRSDSDVRKTTDGFSSWTTVYNTNDAFKRMQDVAVSPSFSSDHTVYGGYGNWQNSDSGPGAAVKSVNGGLIWSVAAPHPLDSYSINVESVAFSPGYNAGVSGRTFVGTNKFGCCSNGHGIIYSDVGETTWHDSTGLPNNYGAVSIAASPNFGTDHTVFAAVNGLDPDGGIYRSIDGGTNWTKPTMTKVVEGWYFTGAAVAVSPDYVNDHTVFAASQAQGVYRSTDGGDSWTALTGKPGLSTSQISSVVLSPGYTDDHTLFAATGGLLPDMVFMSTDQGENWQEITTGSQSFQVYCLAVSPDYQNDKTLFVGTAYSGIWAYSQVVPKPVSTITDPVEGALMPHGFVSRNITGTASCDDGIKKVEVSTDGGTSWHTADGTTSWSYTWDNPVTPGVYKIQSKATSDTDTVETPSAGINVRVDKYALTGATYPEDGSYGTVSMSAPSIPPYYTYGDVATLTPHPGVGYYFSNWGGDATGTVNPLDVTMTADKTITAFFEPKRILTLTAGAGGTVGAVQDRTATYYINGEIVRLTATPNAGYSFSGWSGGATGIVNPLDVTMNASKTINANFTAKTGLKLSITQNGTSVTYKVEYYVGGVPQTAKAIKLYAKLKTAAAWTLKATVNTSATDPTKGTLSKAVTFTNGAYYLKAVYSPTASSTTTSNQVTCVVGAVAVPVQGVTNPNITADPTPKLTWTAFAGATGYVIQTSAGSTFAAGTFTESSNLGSAAGADLPVSMSLPRGLMRYWRVIALIPTGRSVPSAARYITYKESTSFTGLSANASGKVIQPSVTLVGANGGIPSGKTVTFYYKKDTAATWVTATAITNSSGLARISLPKTLTANGTYHIYAKFLGDASYGAKTSAQVQFTLPAP